MSSFLLSITMRPKIPKSATRIEIRVKIDIRPGPASPAQKVAWRRFWQKLIAEVKSEC